jgi:histidinol-phosphate/aromatic aminotransferase/cobyric acid decarboxylase-like protein
MPGEDSGELAAAFLRRGVIMRPLSRGWMRVTVGSESENRRFVEVLDEVLDAIRD